MLLLFILNALLFYFSNGDVFTAITDLEKLLVNEAKSSSSIINNYIDMEKQRLQKLKEIATKYEKKNKETEGDSSNVVTNPIRAYLLIKRLLKDWTYIQNIMNSNSASNFIENIKQGRITNEIKYPDDEDINGAAIAILRLQDTYKLKTSDLIKGIIDGESVNSSFTIDDCIEIGRAAYNSNEYYHTVEWMQEALNKFDPKTQSIQTKIEILEYLAISLYYQGNNKRALYLTMQIAELDPEHTKAQGNIKWYKENFEEKDKTNFNDLPPLINEHDNTHLSRETINYEKLCRGEYQHNLSAKSEVYCYYKKDRPFLKLAPIKVEILRLKPLVVMFRQVISDDEIEVIKTLATPKLRRATVQNAKTGKYEYASYRISKSAWLTDHDHEVVSRINKRIDLMTNLNQETAEEFQVANYGIGGHYEPHYDMSLRGEKDPYKGSTGNRIATVLFYLTQIKKGGATVFTKFNEKVDPSKYDALFWYNLKRDGEGDLRTRHAACPVLLGNKWVSNKWIHERGQEFRRPCGLSPDAEEKFVGDLHPY